MVYAVVAIRLRFFTAEKEWLSPLHRVFRPASLVFDTQQLRSFWEWEIAAGHYPSSRRGKNVYMMLRLALTFFSLLMVQCRSTWRVQT